MSYRVPHVVRPKVVCVFRRGDQILVAETPDSVRGDTFFGPPGGEIEFGETAAMAARREMREELGQYVDPAKLLGVLENIFVYQGQEGHEIVFVYEVCFEDASVYEREELRGIEAEHPFVLRWERTAELAAGGRRLVPEGLYPLLLDAL